MPITLVTRLYWLCLHVFCLVLALNNAQADENALLSPPVAQPAVTHLDAELTEQSLKPVADKALAQTSMETLDKKKIIAVGDVLSIRVMEDRTGSITLLVDERGNIDMPLIGAVAARGLTCYQLANNIKILLEKSYYYQATVMVGPARSSGRGKIFILGQVHKQGLMEMPSNEVLTVSRAIMGAGGPTTDADLIHVSVVRRDLLNPQQDKRFEVNVGAIYNSGRLDLDIPVSPNDLIFIPSKSESMGEIIISGAVRSPGPYPIPVGAKLTASQALFRAGGFDPYADTTSVKIIRQDPKDPQKQITLRVNVDAVIKKGQRDRDVEILPGDVIVVGEKFFNF